MTSRVRIRAVLLALLVAAGYALALFWNTVLLKVMLGLHLNDLGKFYFDARAFLDGLPMYQPSPATEIPVAGETTRQFLNLNPPHFHLLVLPLARLEPYVALAAWLTTGLAALALSLLAAAREARLAPSAEAVLVAGLALVANAAFGGVLLTGQLTFHLLPVITWAWIAARRERWLQTGVALGLAASIKPFFLLFLLWLAGRRQFGAVLASLATAGAAFALGVLVFGTENLLRWTSILGTVDWHGSPLDASLRALLARTLDATPYYEPFFLAPRLAVLLWMGGAGLVALVSFAVALTGRGREATDRAFAVMALAAVLMSPLGWVYYLPLAFPPALTLLATHRPSGPARWALAAGAVALLVPTAATPLGQPSALLTVSLGSAHFWALALLWLGLLIHARRRGSPAHST